MEVEAASLWACFECGSTEGIHNHHVVPKSLGGTKTIPLCYKCHAKVHGMKSLNTGELVKKSYKRGDKKKYTVGQEFRGHPPYGFDVRDKKLVENNAEQEIIDLIKKLIDCGFGFRRMTQILNGGKLYNRHGNPWHIDTVGNIIQRVRGGYYN